MPPEYYRLSIPISYKDQIMKLFNEVEDIDELYDGNAVRFVEDAIREKVLQFKKMYKIIEDLNKNN